MGFLGLLVPLLFALLRLVTGQYLFSALTSLACAGIALIPGANVDGRLLALALAASVAGDYLLAHQRGHANYFLWGVACFGLGHLAFILYAARRFRFSPAALAVMLALAAGYAFYLTRCVLPKQPAAMRFALSGYTLVSLAGLFFALCLDAAPAERILYALGIASILFSDTMIAEAEFVGHRWARPLILPTYYLCHILIAASRLAK